MCVYFPVSCRCACVFVCLARRLNVCVCPSLCEARHETNYHTPTKSFVGHVLPASFPPSLPPSLTHSLTHSLPASLPPFLPLSLPPSLLSLSLSVSLSLTHTHKQRMGGHDVFCWQTPGPAQGRLYFWYTFIIFVFSQS